MKAKELAEILLQYPDLEVVVRAYDVAFVFNAEAAK